MRLPADTAMRSGDTIPNTAIVTAQGVAPLPDTATVVVDVPVTLVPRPSKQWSGTGAVAGSDAVSSVTIGAANASSSSAQVTSLTVTDATAATWQHFDLVAPITLTALPQGASQARLSVCTQPLSACGETDWITGGTATTVGAPLTLPAGVTAGAVAGVRVEFTGTLLPSAPANGGTVSFDLQLRDTLRSTGATIAPTSTITVNNCVDAAARQATGAPVTAGPSCDTQQIWPSTVTLGNTTKTWVPDANGNWQTDSGEYAVAGRQSGVTARIRARNQSPFPIHQIVITEPSAPSDFDKFDVDKIRLTFPSGATNGTVQITYAAGAPSNTTYPYSSTPTEITLPAGQQPTSVIVTYTGGTAADPSIASAAQAGLDLHGRLTPAVTAPTTLSNCAAVSAVGPTGTTPPTPARSYGSLPVEAVRASGAGTKSASQTEVPEGQPVTFTARLTNNGNVALINPVFTDPANPAATPNPFDSCRRRRPAARAR